VAIRKARITPEERQQQIDHRRLARADRWKWMHPAERDAKIHEAIMQLCNYKEAIAEVKKYNYGKGQKSTPKIYEEDQTEHGEEEMTQEDLLKLMQPG
jgi:hypothetical protein